MIFKRLRELRREKGLSQAEVAAMLGVDRRTYSSYETGVNSINAQTLIKLSSIYSSSVDYMLGLSDTRNK